MGTIEHIGVLIIYCVGYMKGHPRKNINFQPLSKEESIRLKQRITSSVYGYLRRENFIKYGVAFAAAGIVVLLSVGIFNSSNHGPSSIETFAKTVDVEKAGPNIQLVLGDQQKVEISEDHSSIRYSSTGAQVQVGKERPIHQNTLNNNQPIFNTLIVPYGKRSEIVLSDGSKVWLNSGSRLIFPAQFLSDKREVYLEGEAIFEVVHHQKQPFIVTSEHHEVEVLGTVFNISNYKEDPSIYTVLQSGSIQINVKKDKLFNAEHHLKITPGTLATFDRNQRDITTETVATEPYFSWREGVFIFKNDALKSIMKKISRYYNVEIVINDQNLANETFSGHLDVKENIEHVLQTIKDAETSKFDFKRLDQHKIIIN